MNRSPWQSEFSPIRPIKTAAPAAGDDAPPMWLGIILFACLVTVVGGLMYVLAAA